MIQVVAAILEREGQILIGRRDARQSHPLQWEFPGGKVEPGETPSQALARELEEELDIFGARGDEILRYEFAYPGKSPIMLIFFRVISWEGELRNRIYPEMRWAAREELTSIDFVAGDREFLAWYSTASPGINQGHIDRPRLP
jgi:8-oxo-dGTP diphosphatase